MIRDASIFYPVNRDRDPSPIRPSSLELQAIWRAFEIHQIRHLNPVSALNQNLKTSIQVD